VCRIREQCMRRASASVRLVPTGDEDEVNLLACA
jgi:hypothetical protein